MRQQHAGLAVAAGIAFAAWYLAQDHTDAASVDTFAIIPIDSSPLLADPLGVNVSDLTAPPPLIDFGIFSDLGARILGLYKVNEYPKYATAIAEAERRYGLPKDLLARLLYQESRYRPDVIAGFNRSPVGALGIAQFMPATARDFGLSPVSSIYNGQVTQTYDPFASIDAAARYMAQLHRQFNDWKTALMAYNWGPGNVASWLRKASRPPPPAETSTYVAQIAADVPAIA